MNDFPEIKTAKITAFNQEIPVLKLPTISDEYAQKCVDYVENLPKTLVDELCQSANNYYEDYLMQFINETDPSKVGFMIPESTGGTNILKYFNPLALLLYEPLTDEVGFVIHGFCKLDNEPSFAWVVRGGETIFFGNFSANIKPWSSEDEYIDNNFAPKYFKGHKREFVFTDVMQEALKRKIENPQLNVIKPKDDSEMIARLKEELRDPNITPKRKEQIETFLKYKEKKEKEGYKQVSVPGPEETIVPELEDKIIKNKILWRRILLFAEIGALILLCTPMLIFFGFNRSNMIAFLICLLLFVINIVKIVKLKHKLSQIENKTIGSEEIDHQKEDDNPIK